MKRSAIVVLETLLLFCGSFDLRSQPTVPVITNARVEGDNFRFEYTGPSTPPCSPQAADSLSGPWADLPVPAPGQSHRLFRRNCSAPGSAT